MMPALFGDLLQTDGFLQSNLDPMPERQRIVAIAMAIGTVLVVFELVRRRKLREEYSWVWVATAATVCLLALNQGLLITLSAWIGAANSVSTLFFSAIVFLLAMVLQFSVRLSRLTHRQRTMGQRLALLEEEVQRIQRARKEPAAEPRQRIAAGHDGAA
jgi:hypothetical protein